MEADKADAGEIVEAASDSPATVEPDFGSNETVTDAVESLVQENETDTSVTTSTTSETAIKDDVGENPDTGDASATGMYAGVLAGSAGLFLARLFSKRRRKA